MRIPNGLFVDDLDSTLKYSVHPINNEHNFFEAEEGSNAMKGIALKEGNFEFRLEARDRRNQVIFKFIKHEIKKSCNDTIYLKNFSPCKDVWTKKLMQQYCFLFYNQTKCKPDVP